MPYSLVQYIDSHGTRRLATMGGERQPTRVLATDSVYALAHRGLAEKRELGALVTEFQSEQVDAWDATLADKRVLGAIDHPVDTNACRVWRMHVDGLAEQQTELVSSSSRVELGDSDAQLHLALVAAYIITAHGHLHQVGYALAHGLDTWQWLQLGPECQIEQEFLAGISGISTLGSADEAKHQQEWTLSAPHNAEFVEQMRTWPRSDNAALNGNLELIIVASTPLSIPSNYAHTGASQLHSTGGPFSLGVESLVRWRAHQD
jgi:hypothetical protein